jgi:protein-tyrosine phosphatase
MYDIHSHILPGLDDGSRSLGESLEMLRIAAAHGTKGIVASPHADTHYRFDSQRVDDLLAELRAAAPEAPEIYRGCDFHLTFDNIDEALSNPARYTINGRNYLLMELSDITIFQNTSSLWSRLEDAGMVIVLTHPERNALLRQRLSLVQEWVSMGRLMQVTAQSLTGLFGRDALEFSRRLLDLGLVHFIASDAHDTRRRTPRLDEAFAWLSRNYSQRLAELLCVEHPQAAIEGQPIHLAGFPPPRQPAQVHRPLWKRILGR